MSKLGVTVNADVKKVPVITYGAPTCSTSISHGFKEDLCSVGSYSGFLIDSVCNCALDSVHNFYSSVPVDSWVLEFLGGNMKPFVVEQSDIKVSIIFQAISPASTPIYCPSFITDSAFEITASHEYSYKTVKVLAVQC
jgi:hypothetical protein